MRLICLIPYQTTEIYKANSSLQKRVSEVIIKEPHLVKTDAEEQFALGS
jgi:hypothetical protein